MEAAQLSIITEYTYYIAWCESPEDHNFSNTYMKTWKIIFIYRQVLFYALVTFLKNVTQIKHKIPIKNSIFPGD